MKGDKAMTDIIIRNLPGEVVHGLDSLKGDLSREEFLRRKLAEIVEAGEVPTLRHGQGLRAFAPSGGAVRLVQYVENVGGGASGLTRDEFDAYKRARLVADPRNGGDWAKARETLVKAGFEVFWD